MATEFRADFEFTWSGAGEYSDPVDGLMMRELVAHYAPTGTNSVAAFEVEVLYGTDNTKYKGDAAWELFKAPQFDDNGTWTTLSLRGSAAAAVFDRHFADKFVNIGRCRLKAVQAVDGATASQSAGYKVYCWTRDLRR